MSNEKAYKVYSHQLPQGFEIMRSEMGQKVEYVIFERNIGGDDKNNFMSGEVRVKWQQLPEYLRLTWPKSGSVKAVQWYGIRDRSDCRGGETFAQALYNGNTGEEVCIAIGCYSRTPEIWFRRPGCDSMESTRKGLPVGIRPDLADALIAEEKAAQGRA